MGAQLGGGGSSRRSGGGRGYRRSQFSDINVTPFVDVMLVLLIIFMVTAPMLTAGVSVDLPESSAKPVGGEDEPLSVTVATGGKVYIQETEVDVQTLGAKLNAIVGEKRDTRIFVRGDKNVSYGEVMRVMGEINAAGLTKVALLTEALQ
jgi:biopolymer transport protein TolR